MNWEISEAMSAGDFKVLPPILRNVLSKSTKTSSGYEVRSAAI
jgi:hypothetical protein